MASRTITNAAAEFLPENKLRKSLVIQNEDTTINVYVKFEKPGSLTVSTTDHDHRIGPGGGMAISTGEDGAETLSSRVTIIAASGTPLVSYFETEDVRR